MNNDNYYANLLYPIINCIVFLFTFKTRFIFTRLLCKAIRT